ncbi:hypothetical protein E3N88_32723 [Mikania micrantha]|uniref:Uncharacterized protein n=1 Tax=Mikania micrantha TaxID=192012 RepID=A0A5N6M9Z4_9ASTR|nr:hypothetical protein E3N88_32723 [Mikania micrantha]
MLTDTSMARTKQNHKSIGRKASRKQPATKAVWKSVLVQEVIEILASRTSGDYHEHEDHNGTRRRRHGGDQRCLMENMGKARRRPSMLDGSDGRKGLSDNGLEEIHSRNYDDNNETNYTVEKGVKEGRIRKMRGE